MLKEKPVTCVIVAIATFLFINAILTACRLSHPTAPTTPTPVTIVQQPDPAAEALARAQHANEVVRKLLILQAQHDAASE